MYKKVLVPLLICLILTGCGEGTALTGTSTTSDISSSSSELSSSSAVDDSKNAEVSASDVSLPQAPDADQAYIRAWTAITNDFSSEYSTLQQTNFMSTTDFGTLDMEYSGKLTSWNLTAVPSDHDGIAYSTLQADTMSYLGTINSFMVDYGGLISGNKDDTAALRKKINNDMNAINLLELTMVSDSNAVEIALEAKYKGFNHS